MRAARGFAWLVGGLTLLAAGVYVLRYLYFWEWHRALITGLLFVGAEVAVATALVLRKLSAVDRNPSRRPQAPDPVVLARIRQAAPRRDHFAWLTRHDGELGVFITLLLGGGIIVSGLAWVVEKVAGNTAAPAMEHDLASRLSTIAFPSGGLVPDDGELLAQEGPYAEDEQLRLLLGPRSRR